MANVEELRQSKRLKSLDEFDRAPFKVLPDAEPMGWTTIVLIFVAAATIGTGIGYLIS